MIYPKKTPKQAQEDQQSKKIINQQQRDQLKALVSQKFQDKYPNKDAASLQGKVDKLFEGQQPLTSAQLKEFENNLAQSEKGGKTAAVNHDRDDISVKSGVSKMSGATDFVDHEKLSEPGAKKDGSKVIDLISTRKPKTNNYRNEEEEWADIYKYNQEVYKTEAQLEKERKEHEKIKFKTELDGQVVNKQVKKQIDEEWKKVDHEQVLLKIKKDEDKEKKKVQVEQAKVAFQKEMRDKQIKENKHQRKQDVREEKQLDRYIMTRIREEQQEEERLAKKRREEDQAAYRKLLQENEEKRHLALQERDRERKAEIKQIEEHVKMVEAREKERADEVKAKDEKIRKTLEAAKELIGKPADEREKRQEAKVKKWTDRKEAEEKREEQRDLDEAKQRRFNNKAYLEKQIQETKDRKVVDKKERNEQAVIWKNSNDKYNDWEKQKNEERQQQMKSYADVLKKQMSEKFEERRVTDRLFDVRATMHENKQSIY